MNVLTPEQQHWLETEVAAGRFQSVETAVRMAVADFKAINTGDLHWAKQYVDEARQSVAGDDVVSGAAFLRGLDDHLTALRSSAQIKTDRR